MALTRVLVCKLGACGNLIRFTQESSSNREGRLVSSSLLVENRCVTVKAVAGSAGSFIATANVLAAFNLLSKWGTSKWLVQVPQVSFPEMGYIPKNAVKPDLERASGTVMVGDDWDSQPPSY